MPMLAAEMANVTVKPSMILARNRRVGNLIDNDPLRFGNPTSTPCFRSENPEWEAPAPLSLRKTTAEWIRVCKFGPFRWVVRVASVHFTPSTFPEAGPMLRNITIGGRSELSLSRQSHRALIPQT